MPEKVLNTPYPVIDIDPHFTRVVRYFRASDYATWGATTVGVPGALLVWEILDPNGLKINRITLSPGEKLPAGRIALGNAIQIVTRRMVAGMRVAAFLGACGGFLLAYQNSSMRFLGFTENAREAQMDLIELSQRAREGKPLYGESHQSPWVQGAAHRNSVFSMLKFCEWVFFCLFVCFWGLLGGLFLGVFGGFGFAVAAVTIVTTMFPCVSAVVVVYFASLYFGVLRCSGAAFPMFNFVNHPHHGVDTSKYGVGVGAKEDAKEAEE